MDDMELFTHLLGADLIIHAVEKKKSLEYDHIVDMLGHYGLLRKYTKSPIELRMGIALLFCEFNGGLFRFQWSEMRSYDEILDGCTIICQMPVGRYIADFGLVVRHGEKEKIIAVECDGHDFHEKTKEQASSDKKRDRYFTSQSIHTLRFTGSEIYNSPLDCSNEVCNLADNLLESMGSK